MNISMRSGASTAELSNGPWDVALVGSAVDERGRAAIDFAKSRATSMMVLEYHADSFRFLVDGLQLEADELAAGLPNLASASFLLESTTLGFVEVFAACRALVRSGAKGFHLTYVEPKDTRPRDGVKFFTDGPLNFHLRFPATEQFRVLLLSSRIEGPSTVFFSSASKSVGWTLRLKTSKR